MEEKSSELHSKPAGVGDPQAAALWAENRDLWAEVRRLRAALERQGEWINMLWGWLARNQWDNDAGTAALQNASKEIVAALAASAPGGEGERK